MASEKKSTILFEAKTHAAYDFKILIDLLNYYLNKKGSFEVNKKGIFLTNINGTGEVLCDLSLYAENFQEYQLYKSEGIFFSINLNTFYNDMLKKIKKKDSISIFIIQEDQRLFIKVTKESPDNKGNQFSSKTSILESKHVAFSPCEGYGAPVNILSRTFQQSCREIAKPTNKEIEITCWNDKMLRFFASKDGTVENEATFGSFKDDGKTVQTETFRDRCHAAHIVRPAKLAGLSQTIKIYVKKDLPIYYKMSVGFLGELGIYIKTLTQMKAEQDTENDETSEGEKE